MTRPILFASLLALAAVPALAGNRGNQRDNQRSGIGYANPSAVIATEIAFARLAQDKGQWTAFRAMAARDAVMFMPRPVYAQDFLKGKADPAQADRWQPHQVWSSCDGSLAVTRGAWQSPGGTTGYFTTVWQRQKDGRYKWVLDQGDPLPTPLDAPEMIAAKVADCPAGYRPEHAARPRAGKGRLPALDPAQLTGRSADGTLQWDVTISADGARRFVLTVVMDGKPVAVQDLLVAAPTK